ncbi:hypothetical protein DCCM_3938 [Desulfocucumis palustris]|uniref:Uncharacterized protein n=1 Tax=Desulfocucumis palustris TaxID=1898651 RepID=A0A2L2XEZ9_9FIRM|nr:putative baseplate assembly protein [Desulfocucumis palustris]GBF34818.1 hypothetical protein DCCM_3938 [Desulfocucumis palustris]
MLPLPDLDDRFFKQIVEESRRKIPRLAPQWTDENYHDPGITLIELFAWLTEMQQYHLNRITLKSELKFLKLLGMRLGDAAPARADVTFDGVTEPVMLPRAAKLEGADKVFETEEPLLLLPAKIEKVIVYDNNDSYDYTSINSHRGVTYFAFGREAAVGNRLYIGFDRALPLNRDIRLTVNLFDGYPVSLVCGGVPGQGVIPSAAVSWKYYGQGRGPEDVPGWFHLQVTGDGTAHMSRSGGITFRVPAPMRPAIIHPAGDASRFWICCTVEEGGYEVAPRVDGITLNAVSAVQRNTLSSVFAFSGNGKPGQSFEVEHYLAYYGINRVQVRDGEGNWRHWKRVEDLFTASSEALCYTLSKNPDSKKTVLLFGSGDKGAVPPQGEGNIRMISFLPGFAGKRILGRSNGLPNQSFNLYEYPVAGESLMIQVAAKLPGSGELVWRDWERVEDFDLSGPGDRHYILDPPTGEIQFGNNEQGAVPGPGEEDDICVIALQTGGGGDGNLKEHEINTIIERPEELREVGVTNPLPGSGGTDRETIDDARRRLRAEFKKQYRAVTCEDYEEIARSTPGLRVARVKAIPLFSPGLKDYPDNKAPAQVTVVVVPYSEQRKPAPGKGFLQTVKRHLDKHRMITTELHVIPPEYIKISVHAVVVTASYIKLDPGKIVEELDRFLDPLDESDGFRGWVFGRTVYKGDIYGVINRIEGVEYIKELWLNAEGVGIRKEMSGDIKIPPHGLVYSGEHEVETVSRREM